MPQSPLHRAEAALLGAQLAAGDEAARARVAAACQGSWANALAELGVARQTLRGWCVRHGIARPRDGRHDRYAQKCHSVAVCEAPLSAQHNAAILTCDEIGHSAPENG